jgi:predicted TIM-barrel fold metal-dependent hydrolase
MQAGNVNVEISMLEGVGGLGSLFEQAPVDRVLFGSHAPMFYFEAAELKLIESALPPEQRRAVSSQSARRLLARGDGKS